MLKSSNVFQAGLTKQLLSLGLTENSLATFSLKRLQHAILAANTAQERKSRITWISRFSQPFLTKRHAMDHARSRCTCLVNHYCTRASLMRSVISNSRIENIPYSSL